MDAINEFVDERQKSWCIHCGKLITELEPNTDHVPSKGLLRQPYPPNLPVVKIHKSCNSEFASDEEYLKIFLHCVLSGATDPERQSDPKVGCALQRHQKLRTRIERSRTEHKTPGGEIASSCEPETKRINRVILKNARGHAFYEYGEPMLAEPTHVWATPLSTMSAEERSGFENIQTGKEFYPEVGSRMLTRVITGQDLSDGWVMVQDGTYRYSVIQHGLMLVRSVLFEHLATEVYWNELMH